LVRERKPVMIAIFSMLFSLQSGLVKQQDHRDSPDFSVVQQPAHQPVFGTCGTN
jgi:hypothetical protein